MTFEHLFTEYRELIFELAMHFANRNRTDAEDLFQEVGLKLLKSRNLLSSISNLKAWLYTIVRNVAHDHWRNTRQREHALEVYLQDRPKALELIHTARDENLNIFSDHLRTAPVLQRYAELVLEHDGDNSAIVRSLRTDEDIVLFHALLKNPNYGRALKQLLRTKVRERIYFLVEENVRYLRFAAVIPKKAFGVALLRDTETFDQTYHDVGASIPTLTCNKNDIKLTLYSTTMIVPRVSDRFPVGGSRLPTVLDMAVKPGLLFVEKCHDILNLTSCLGASEVETRLKEVVRDLMTEMISFKWVHGMEL